MSKKNKKKIFDVGAVVRSNARNLIGQPKSSFIIPGKKNHHIDKSYRDEMIEEMTYERLEKSEFEQEEND